ncbi:asparagine synthase C-terminal domain-containing protein [Dyadobacter sp. CY312]|uniref:asparagine synthase-related protein n=1 Tax=Dyadobacter sp. CY312 TaxID=2907303 RepID=UPI001F272BA2|nr:asparagine synthase C-terminal domain-containing protein [Dyadobacter sp. CY312]MCE7041223.1 asparagine synthase-related protein [Dyadobacter sp. CY312]
MRDAFGTIPLYYIHIPTKGILFSTDIVELLNENNVLNPSKINTSKIFTYLSRNDFIQPYDNDTHFHYIKSVLPGHLISFTNSEIKTDSYLTPLNANWEHLKNEQEYGTVFKDLFLKSVSRGMVNKRHIGSQLSGGLDSSSVSSTLKLLSPNLNLHTFYTDTNTSLSDETIYAREVVQRISSDHHIINPSYNAIDDLIFATQIYGQPVYGSMGTSLLVNLYRRANEIGCDSLFTGHDGDSIVGHGIEYLNELMKQKKWDELRHELSEVAKLDKFSMVYGNAWNSYTRDYRNELIFTRHIYRKLLSLVKQRNYLESFELLVVAQRRFNLDSYSLVNSGIKSLFNKLTKPHKTTTFIQRKDFIVDYDKDSILSYNNPYKSITYNQNIRVIEEQASLGEYFNIDVVHPFFDTQIYDFCKSIPSSILFDHGMGRGPLRTAMKDILPEMVRTRTTKGIYNDYVKRDTILLLSQSQDFLVDTSTVWEYVDKNKFHHSVKILTQKNNSMEIESLMIFFVCKTIFLAVWLQLFQK